MASLKLKVSRVVTTKKQQLHRCTKIQLTTDIDWEIASGEVSRQVHSCGYPLMMTCPVFHCNA